MLLQICLVLGTVAHSSSASKKYITVIHPKEPHVIYNEGLISEYWHNNVEVATALGPANYAEIDITQQPDSAEVSGTEQTNSAENENTTFDPFNSGEVTSAPVVIRRPSGVNNQETLEPNTNKESSDKKGGNTSAGTQPFIPQSTGVKSQGNSGITSGQTGNAANVATAAGTQPFFPQSTGVKAEGESGTISKQPDNTADEELAATTLPSSQNFNEPSSEQASSGNPIHIGSLHDALHVAGVEPISVLAINQETAGEGNNNAQKLDNIPGVEPLVSDSANSVPNALRDALAQVGVSETVDDPLLKDAKQYFISIWNLEARRLGAPYLEVTDVWPEIGMVYMPTINQMSSRIQNSKPVKEAAERLKSVSEELHSATEGNEPSSSLLADFMNFWGLGRSQYPDEIGVEDDLSAEVSLRRKPQAETGNSSPVSKPGAHQRPANPIHPANQRPATKQNVNFSFDSLELDY
ncbi:uncharacterized protein LOC135222793 [Macrobrachium nipponense]|uniref:uncharacterized protein LOC135222793 n=1 Tax=Macrobrachium nipponense TaxID=159736 RepID=UPI0030C86657